MTDFTFSSICHPRTAPCKQANRDRKRRTRHEEAIQATDEEETECKAENRVSVCFAAADGALETRPIVSVTRSVDWSLIGSRSIKVAGNVAEGRVRAVRRMWARESDGRYVYCLRWPRLAHSGQITACWTKTPSRQPDARSTICVAGDKTLFTRSGKVSWNKYESPVRPHKGVLVINACDILVDA